VEALRPPGTAPELPRNSPGTKPTQRPTLGVRGALAVQCVLLRGLRGFVVRCVSGPGVGVEARQAWFWGLDGCVRAGNVGLGGSKVNVAGCKVQVAGFKVQVAGSKVNVLGSKV